MSTHINLDYRPKSYFRPVKIEEYLFSKIKSAVLRDHLELLFEQGRHDEVGQISQSLIDSPEDRKALEAVHPMFMGGNYLPDTDDGEIEIARISINSTTSDVTCVYAKPVNGKIEYRVVDEYEGDTLNFPTEATTDVPMSLREFTEFFLKAWPLIDVLEMNFESDIERALGFFRAHSKFYSDLDAFCRLKVIEHFPDPEDLDDEE
jgi:hypothetical protein